MACRAASAALVAAFSLVPAVSDASGGVSVRYRAPSACPDQRTFEAELDRRLGDASRPNTVLDVDVSVQEAGPESSRVHGRLLRDGRPARQLEGSTCDEVVKALALVAALAILPLEQANAPSSAADPPSGAGQSPSSRSRESRPDALEQADLRGLRPPPRGAIFVDFAGTLDTFTSPKPALGASVGAQVRLPGPATAPVVLVDLSVTAKRRADVGPIRSDFGRVGGRISACPVGIVWGPFLLRPCAGLAVDRIHGESSGIAAPRSASAVFGSGHVFGRLSKSLAQERFVLGFGAGVVIPFAPPRFIVEDPIVSVYQLPGVAFLGQFDLAVRVF